MSVTRSQPARVAIGPNVWSVSLTNPLTYRRRMYVSPYFSGSCLRKSVVSVAKQQCSPHEDAHIWDKAWNSGCFGRDGFCAVLPFFSNTCFTSTQPRLANRIWVEQGPTYCYGRHFCFGYEVSKNSCLLF